MNESRVGRWLFVPAAPSVLAVVRIAVGVYALGWLAFTSSELLGLGRLDPARFEPVGIVALSGIGPAFTATLGVVVAGTALAAMAVVLGWRHRVSGPMFALGLLWLTTYQNSWSKLLHTENVLVLHALVLAIAPAADAWSIRTRRSGPEPASERYGWPLRVMALTTVLSYVTASVTKMRHGGLAWFDPGNLRNWLAYDLVRKELFGDPYLRLAVPALRHPWLLAPAILATLAIELGAPIALTGPRAAVVWVRAAWTFHLAVLATMSVAFPYQLLGIAFLPVILSSRLPSAVPRLGRQTSHVAPVARSGAVPD